MRQLKKLARRGIAQALIATFILTNSLAAAWSAPQSAGWSAPGQPLANDHLLVLLAPHANREQAKADFLQYAQAQTVNDIHFNNDDRSILVLSPPTGQREQTLNKIVSMGSSHPEIIHVQRNYLRSPHGSSNANATQTSTAAGPNDPYFFVQWELGAMMWTQAWNNYANKMKRAATVVVLGQDCVPAGTEFGPNVTKYIITNNQVTGPVPLNPKNATSEGCADSSIPGAVTNNNLLMAGTACFRSGLPCNIILIQALNDEDRSTAIAWIVNNRQHINSGNAVPVDMSFGSGKVGVALWAEPTYQALGQELLNANDIFVISAGDTDSQYYNESTGTIAAIQATDKKNKFFLVEAQNDPMEAPGVDISIIKLQGTCSKNPQFSGSSASCPLWGACIALLIAFNPKLSGAQANQILVNTGTQNTAQTTSKVTVANPWVYVIPNVNAAINAALTQTPPPGNMPPSAPPPPPPNYPYGYKPHGPHSIVFP